MGSGCKTRFRSALPLALWRRRTSGEPSREDATREETDGADSQDEPKTMKEADAGQRLRSAARPGEEDLRRAPKGACEGSAERTRKRYRPGRQALKVGATSDEE
jgi:hypothetical protein